MHKRQLPGHISLLLYGLGIKLEVVDLVLTPRFVVSSVGNELCRVVVLAYCNLTPPFIVIVNYDLIDIY